MKIQNVIDYLETIAPRGYQESYDNSGLLTGNPGQEITEILLTLDCTEEVVEEAIDRGCNLIIAHHPILFRGLKKLTGSTYIERTVIKAIKNDIAIYAIHTNLDNVYNGVNRKIGEKIGLVNLSVLEPKKDTLKKLVVFIPKANTGDVLDALYKAGAGEVGKYKNCSFQVVGTGTFMPTEGTNPHIGTSGNQEWVDEVRAELIFPSHLEWSIIAALKKSHPYEEVAYYVNSIANENQEVGAGLVGELKYSLDPIDFLKHLKEAMSLDVIRYTRLLKKPVRRVAICGGSGAFLLQKAIWAGADFFVTADFKYHEFFDAENRLTIADIGHYESEVYTKELLYELLIKKFPTFAVNFSTIVTNPIRYYI